MSPVPAVVSGLDPQRAAEVIVDRAAGAKQRGSGYLVTDWLVLTAAHVLAGAVGVGVRFNADQAGEWSAQAETAWSDSGLDIALLHIVGSSIAPPGMAPVVGRVRYGRITRPPVDCEALGFPLFKVRQDPARPGADGGESHYRDSHHAIGTATSWSNQREGTMAVDVRAPERDPVPGRSPWEGMSGAAVFSGDLLIGVIGEHHRSDGLGTLAAYRIDYWYRYLTPERMADLAALIGLPRTPNALTDLVARTQPRAATAPRQLPATTAAFAGRQDELAQILTLADAAHAGQRSGTMVISAIDGMAGIGKTALAVHAGHLLAARFPDGQLFIDLHGYTEGMPPREPADALAVFLQAFDVPPQQIPGDLEARAALFRNRLAGTRTLVVLDNAATEIQVRPLLPGAGGCLVLVTSRRRLRALDDAYALSLDVLPPPDAVALFRAVAGPGRTAADDPLLEEICELCGHLPLALRITAALIRHRRSWSLRHLADKLRQARPDLVGFADGDRQLAAVFDLSYRSLGEDQRLLYRRLGLVPGPDADAYAAAALLDTLPVEAEHLLQDLVDHSLLTEPAEGRYRMHDLLRLHARTLTGSDPVSQRDPATERLLDYYQHTACRAEARIARYSRPEPAGLTPAQAPALPDADSARAWLRAERANLEAAFDHAADHGRGERVVALSMGLAGLLRADGPWAQALALHTIALTAARSLGDELGQASALNQLGGVRGLTGGLQGWTGDYRGAAQNLEAALQQYRDLGDRPGQANALTELGIVLLLIGDYRGAAQNVEVALQLYRDLGHRPGQANALTELGDLRGRTGDYDGAVRDLEQALQLFQDMGSRFGQANALTRRGTVRRMSGDHLGAVRDLEEALRLFREIGARGAEAWALNPYAAAVAATGDLGQALRLYGDAQRLAREVQQPDDEALALEGIGECLLREGFSYDGAAHLNQALAIFRRLEMPDAERVAARLAQLGDS